MAACGGRCALGHLPPQGWTLRMLFLSRGVVISINYYVTKILLTVNQSSNILQLQSFLILELTPKGRQTPPRVRTQGRPSGGRARSRPVKRPPPTEVTRLIFQQVELKVSFCYWMSEHLYNRHLTLLPPSLTHLLPWFFALPMNYYHHVSRIRSP